MDTKTVSAAADVLCRTCATESRLPDLAARWTSERRPRWCALCVVGIPPGAPLVHVAAGESR